VAAAVRKTRRDSGFGIGFRVTKFQGHRLVGHGGAIYGFATELAALPDDKLGVVAGDHKKTAPMP